MNPRELPTDRLSTTDARGHRIYLYPTDVRGHWKKLRTRLSIGLIAVFLFLPWARIGGHQAVLFDLPRRRFALFGLTFWAHDTPLLFFVLGGAAITIAFTTAIWGRVWCGWACPQTVFVEHVFRRIERWIEGDALARKKLDGQPLSFVKVFKKSLKWSAFTALSLIIGHSFLAYFVGVEDLRQMMTQPPLENLASFLVMAAVSLVVLFDFGWFREQFCTVVCPYGRFQSVLMDHQSAVIAYDAKRGEPRRGTAAPEGTQAGDCVDCHRCVLVCPTGIDIRRGVQLECIACTACVDACDDVMRRTKKPEGLIRYANQALSEGRTETWTPWYQRARAWVYLALLVTCGGGLYWATAHRSPIEITLIRGIEAPYQVTPSGIINHFKMDVRNQTFTDQSVSFSVSPELQQKGVKLIISHHKDTLKTGEPERADLFITYPKEILTFGKAVITIEVTAIASDPSPHLELHLNQEVHLVGPLQ